MLIWRNCFSNAPSVTDRFGTRWREAGRPATKWSTIFVPFCEEQSQHWSFPGNRITHRITACCSSTRLGLPLPASALPLASNARNRARSLQFTRTDIHARWSASSSAWKWYVLLSGIETMTSITQRPFIVKKRRTGISWKPARISSVTLTAYEIEASLVVRY